VIYLTNRSLSVAQSDEVSHVSPLESSSSVVRLNHPVLVVGVDPFFSRDDSFDEFLLLDDDEELPRKKPSMALPIMRASTIALFPSHLRRFSGDRCSFFFLESLAFSRDVVALFVDDDDDDFASVSLSKVSFAKLTVAWAEDLTVFERFEAGMWRFVNQPLAAAAAAADDFESSANCCLTPFKIDTSKLFERFDFLRLLLRSGCKKFVLLLLFDADGDFDDGGCVCMGVGTSFIRLISVAEEASDESKESKSVLVHIMPTFFDGLGVGARDTLGDMSMLGFSDARRCCGMGARVVWTKSEKRLLV
jgi:hypothetical protein